MRRAMILPILGVMACASAPIGSTPDHSILGSAAEGGLRISGDAAKVTIVTYPLTRVWGVLPEVYDSLGMPIGDVDAERFVIGNTDLKVTRVLGKAPLSRFLDCGTGQGFQSADTYLIQMSVLTQLTADKSGATSISTVIQATAKPMAFGGVVVRCTTKYTLEALIVDGVKARLLK